MLDIRIPISPTPAFFSNVWIAAESLRRLGPPYSEAEIVVSVGGEQVEAPWAQDYPIRWRFAPLGPLGHHGTSLDRFVEHSPGMTIFCDADLCTVRRFDELLETLAEGPTVAGLQAHSFSQGKSAEGNQGLWRHLFREAGLPEPQLTQSYSLDIEKQWGEGPSYFNYGFVAFDAVALGRVAASIREDTALAGGALRGSKYQGQVGLALSMVRSGARIVQLGHGMNCANDDRVFKAGLEREEDIRAIHFLRREEFDRHDFLTDPAAFSAFREPKQGRVNEVFRRHVCSLVDEGPIKAPFGRS